MHYFLFSSRKKDEKREKSLSPLSKRMALMDPTHDGDGKNTSIMLLQFKERFSDIS
jgi:hypothetical protein